MNNQVRYFTKRKSFGGVVTTELYGTHGMGLVHTHKIFLNDFNDIFGNYTNQELLSFMIDEYNKSI
jgi:hypothetical protein